MSSKNEIKMISVMKLSMHLSTIDEGNGEVSCFQSPGQCRHNLDVSFRIQLPVAEEMGLRPEDSS